MGERNRDRRGVVGGPRQVLVFGTGGLGSLLAARLAADGSARVIMVGTWAQALRAVAEDGVAVLEAGGHWTVSRPLAASLFGPLPVSDLALVVVKSTQTRDVAAHVARSLGPDGVALTLQNGLGNADVLADHLGPNRVLSGVTSLGAGVEGPGRVLAAGEGPTLLGDNPGAPVPADLVAEYLSRAGVPADVAADLDAAVWRKLAVNCAINPVSALLGLTNGQLLERADACLALGSAAEEAGAVAGALGIELGGDPAAMVFEVAHATAPNRSSMLRDAERGAPTEIDAINGAVVLRGRGLGVPTPVNEWLWRSVAALPTGVPASFRANLDDCPLGPSPRRTPPRELR